MIAEVRRRERPFLGQRRLVVAHRRRRGAQEADQVGDQPRGGGGALLRELLRATQRVEQEVRLDLQLQHPELRFGELARQRALPRLGLEVAGQRHVLAIAQVDDQRRQQREQEAEGEPRGDHVAQLGHVVDELERVDALDEAGDAGADERPGQCQQRPGDDVAEDPALELAVAEPDRQPGPDQRQHQDVEQDRRLDERHVPRQLRGEPRDQRRQRDDAGSQRQPPLE